MRHGEPVAYVFSDALVRALVVLWVSDDALDLADDPSACVLELPAEPFGLVAELGSSFGSCALVVGGLASPALLRAEIALVVALCVMSGVSAIGWAAFVSIVAGATIIAVLLPSRVPCWGKATLRVPVGFTAGVAWPIFPVPVPLIVTGSELLGIALTRVGFAAPAAAVELTRLLVSFALLRGALFQARIARFLSPVASAL
jgi:hypothetical protein